MARRCPDINFSPVLRPNPNIESRDTRASQPTRSQPSNAQWIADTLSTSRYPIAPFVPSLNRLTLEGEFEFVHMLVGRNHARRRNRDDEAAARATICRLFPENLPSKVPAEEEDVIRLVREQSFRVYDRQSLPGHELSLFERVCICDKVEKSIA